MKEVFRYMTIFMAIILIMVLLNFKFFQEDSSNIARYSLNVIKKDTFWIYEISENDKLFIRQEFIPAVKGKQVFRSKKDAETIGKIVLDKLDSSKNPFVTIKDLKSNKIIFKDI